MDLLPLAVIIIKVVTNGNDFKFLNQEVPVGLYLTVVAHT